MDIPGSADHKNHKKPIPLTGGFVLISIIIIMVYYTELWEKSKNFRCASVWNIHCNFGLLDDFFNLSPIKKLSGQILGFSFSNLFWNSDKFF